MSQYEDRINNKKLKGLTLFRVTTFNCLTSVSVLLQCNNNNNQSINTCIVCRMVKPPLFSLAKKANPWDLQRAPALSSSVVRSASYLGAV